MKKFAVKGMKSVYWETFFLFVGGPKSLRHNSKIAVANLREILLGLDAVQTAELAVFCKLRAATIRGILDGTLIVLDDATTKKILVLFCEACPATWYADALKKKK